MMEKAVLITGGNLSGTVDAMAAARERINESVGRITECSRIYESPPWGTVADGSGNPDPSPFLNQVLVVQTSMCPHELLDAIHLIEKDLGRDRSSGTPSCQRQIHGVKPEAGMPERERAYLSRTLDIDILFYGDHTLETPRLTIPHPELHRREFVLVPLAEIMPGYRHPVSGYTINELSEKLKNDKE